MSTGQNIPQADRPHIPQYGIPETLEGVLPWSHVTGRLAAARNYWIATVTSDGLPHAVPVWGVWVQDQLFFGGGRWTRWARNLAAKPEVVVHLENAEDVVIIKGGVEMITEATHPLAAPVDAAYVAKYNIEHGLPVFRLVPRTAFAWTSFPADTTRWRFSG